MTEFIETEIGKIPSYWSIDKLENHLLIKGRIGWKNLKVSEYGSEGPYIVGGLQIKELGIDWDECAHVTEARYEESPEIMLKNEDILMTKDGTIGKLAFVDGLKYRATVASHIHVIRRASDKIISKFLFYFFKSPVFGQIIESKITGSVIPALTQFDINNTYFPIPPLEEQNSIASVLGCLDDKIDLLHRQNTTLERMAETLFRQWFVEEAQEDWEEKPLSSIANFLNGLACQKFPPTDSINKLPVLKIKELSSGISENSDWATSNVKPEYIVENGDVIFAWSASLMVKVWDGEKCVLNQHLFKVTSQEFPKWFYLQWCKYYLDEFISISSSHATTMGHIKRGDLDTAIVKVPKPEQLIAMTEQMAPLLEKQIINAKQIKTLEKLRDNLLPKLMSGEVRINND